MAEYWCVNFGDAENLRLGLKRNFWSQGYQYDPDGGDSPGRLSAITRNWKRLEEIRVGDFLVAYLKGNRYFAIGRVIPPRRTAKKNDTIDSIDDYLKGRKSYRHGYIYFPPTVAYDNFETEVDALPLRIDVDGWQNVVAEGVQVELPVLPRWKTVYAAYSIVRSRYSKILKALETGENEFSYAEEIPDQASSGVPEGAKKTITVNVYERNSVNRSRCIEFWGYQCQVCGIDMGEFYGELGEAFIHVHHVKELSKVSKGYVPDPQKDLQPVCPNCHAVLHRSKPAMSITKLRNFLARRGTLDWPVDF
jgi:hypothetical protein